MDCLMIHASATVRVAAAIPAAALITAAMALAAGPGRADEVTEALAFCRSAGDDNRIYAIPDRLLPGAARMLGVEAPAGGPVRGVWRCMDGRLMLCIPGGERHCGRADTQVIPSPEARQYCRNHVNAPEVPRWAAGRDNIFAWRCEGPQPVIVRAARTVDRRGFVAEYWRAYNSETQPGPPSGAR